MELNRHFVLPRFLWTAQGKDELKWVGLNTFEFLSQILKFSLKYETSKFCLQNQKPLYYITHTQTNYNKIIFFRRKNPKVLQGACPFPPQPPCSEAPTYGVNSNQFSVDISFSNLAKSKIQSQKAMYISLCIDFYFYLLFLSNITLI